MDAIKKVKLGARKISIGTNIDEPGFVEAQFVIQIAPSMITPVLIHAIYKRLFDGIIVEYEEPTDGIEVTPFSSPSKVYLHPDTMDMP